MNEDTYRDKLNDLQLEVEALRAKLKEAQTGDMISRAAAIDALREIEFSHYMEFGEYIGEDTREVRLIRAEKAQDTIEQLPSAQPEQITCKDCKHCTFNAGAKIYCDELDMRMYQWDYCSRAERREE